MRDATFNASICFFGGLGNKNERAFERFCVHTAEKLRNTANLIEAGVIIRSTGVQYIVINLLQFLFTTKPLIYSRLCLVIWHQHNMESIGRGEN